MMKHALVLLVLASAALGGAATNARQIGSLPLHFEEHPARPGHYWTRSGSHLVIVGTRGLEFVGRDQSAAELRVEFLNRAGGEIGAEQPTGGVTSWHLGQPASRPKNLPHFRSLRHRGLLPGIDVVYYGNPKAFEFDYMVKPGADPRRIAMRITGTKTAPRRTADGALELCADSGCVRLLAPVAYQESAQGRRAVAAEYRVAEGGTDVFFALGEYDRERELIIDPALAYVALPLEDAGVTDAAIGPDGGVYLTGVTRNRFFPITPGAYSREGIGFVMKLNAAGTKIEYSTYIADAIFLSLAVDAAGHAIVTGRGRSSYPSLPEGDRCFRQCTVVTKLNPTGTGLVFSRIYGGESDDGFGSGVAVDPAGAIYATGATWATYGGMTRFPTTPGSYQPAPTDRNQCFVMKLNPESGAQVFSTFFSYGCAVLDFPQVPDIWSSSSDYFAYGAANPEQAFSPQIAVDHAGRVSIAGYSSFLRGFPTTAGAPNHRADSGGQFFAKFDEAGRRLLAAGTLGGLAYGMRGDAQGNLYLTGTSRDGTFPTTPGTLNPTPTNPFEPYIVKINPEGAIAYSTFLPQPAGRFDVDSQGRVTFATTWRGHTPLTADAIGRTGEIYLAQLDSAARRIAFGTLLMPRTASGNSVSLDVRVTALRLDVRGDAIFATEFRKEFFQRMPAPVPTTGGALQVEHEETWQRLGYVTKVSFEGTGGAVQPTISGITSAGFEVRAIAPHALFTIFGSNFAPAGTMRTLGGGDVSGGRLPSQLANVCVEVAGQRAGLLLVSPNQINAMAPNRVPNGMATVTVILNCDAPSAVRVAGQVNSGATAADWLYIAREPGKAPRVLAINATTGEVIAPPGSIPGLTTVNARPGDVITLFGTGFGLTNPEVPNLGVATAAAPLIANVGTIWDQEGAILYAGATPGFAGLYQINVRVPATLRRGDHFLGLSRMPIPAGLITVQ